MWQEATSETVTPLRISLASTQQIFQLENAGCFVCLEGQSLLNVAMTSILSPACFWRCSAAHQAIQTPHLLLFNRSQRGAAVLQQFILNYTSSRDKRQQISLADVWYWLKNNHVYDVFRRQPLGSSQTEVCLM